jgi:lactate dehydrogenase-like 2-hydroxyacid dehydrogenase
MIAMRCAGFDRVDLKAAEEHGIKVARVPTYSPTSVAEHALSLLMALNRLVEENMFMCEDAAPFTVFVDDSGIPFRELEKLSCNIASCSCNFLFQYNTRCKLTEAIPWILSG